MRYSVCAALTAVLVAFVAYFLLGSFWPDVGAVVAVAVMGAFILEGGNPDDDPKEGEDIPEDELREAVEKLGYKVTSIELM